MSGPIRFGNQVKRRDSDNLKSWEATKRCPDCNRLHRWKEPSDMTVIECPCGKRFWVKTRTPNTNAERQEGE